ncbi:hypothetical protein NMY22_g2020 [Coprinellus aureogranulatus]|nr:hypothetical protein NMY22_g2020 [Coprinellus aureogranulatus]
MEFPSWIVDVSAVPGVLLPSVSVPIGDPRPSTERLSVLCAQGYAFVRVTLDAPLLSGVCRRALQSCCALGILLLRDSVDVSAVPGVLLPSLRQSRRSPSLIARRSLPPSSQRRSHAPAPEPEPATAPAPETPVDPELEKRKARAARFGIPLVEQPAPKPAKVPTEDDEKLKARAARFGTSKEPESKKRSAPAVDPEEAERRRKRAERFGL